MTDFIALKTRFNEFLKSSDTRFVFNGINFNQFFLTTLKDNIGLNESYLVVCKDESDAINNHHRCKKLGDAALFLGFDKNPYSGHILSHSNQYYRFRTLTNLTTQQPKFIVTTFEALFLKCPPKHFFSTTLLTILQDDILSPIELSATLVDLGYIRVDFIEEPGHFSIRGEILDIFLSPDTAVRLNYFDELIESIHYVDIETKTTQHCEKLEIVHIGPTPLVLTKNSTIIRENLPIKPEYNKEVLDFRKTIFEKLKSNFLFDEYPLFIPKFFEETSLVFDYIDLKKFVCVFDDLEFINKQFELYKEEIFKSFEQGLPLNPLIPNPSDIYDFNRSTNQLVKIVDVCEINLDHNNNDQHQLVSLKFEPLSVLINKEKIHDKNESINKTHLLLKFIKAQIGRGSTILFAIKKQQSEEIICNILKSHSFSVDEINQVRFVEYFIDEGFYYKNESITIVSESDLLGTKKKVAKKVKAETNIFAEQIATLKPGDFVIHKEHGMAKYLGMENLTFNDKSSDFIILEYKDGDKVYVPVHRLDLIQKYSDSIANVSLASLKSNKFLKEKQKARESVKKLAFNLLELNAKRKLAKGFAFSEPNEYFHEFEKEFPFEETPDQLTAINDVLSDMQATQPMDRLVCGDVGFGKTEIAMRAAFKAVLDSKQVIILVPTTVLAYQHYNSFIKRFKKFPVNIQYLSRFKTTKEANEIKKELKEGSIDIVIGTHMLLSEKIMYQDLGLLIVDEEHRFGVGHKEKIKNLRTNVDCLTLTATPIPRTLQLSFLGIRDLSLIRTAPPKKQSIKTYVIKDNPITLKQAIETELARGGQIFIVHNKVHDIEEFTAKIKKLVPQAKIVFAHGQLPERDLEKRIKSFYDKQFDILISTTIIESGIDIPTANTMIIDRADTFGLAQLHQLRGRIGRSDKKAYAYLSIPSNRLISEIATKRLKTLQTYADMGAGFSISSADLELRGSGDILGAEQSGHIHNIGLELYMDLLEETINEIKGKKETEKIHNIEIQTPFPAFIPNSYISSSSQRLRYYKRLSSSKSEESINNLKEELVDIYGIFPEPVENLFLVISSRIILQSLPIESVKVANKSIIIKFDETILSYNQDIRESIINLFISRPKVYKLNPNYSVKCSFKEIVDKNTLIEFSKYIVEHI